jgi:hypothetical protein
VIPGSTLDCDQNLENGGITVFECEYMDKGTSAGILMIYD